MVREINCCLRSDRIDDYFNYDFREARIEAGYTGPQLAELVGVSASAISSYERLRAFPNPLVARRLARILHRKVAELFPKQLTDYVREIHQERRGSNDALDHSVCLTGSVERRVERRPDERETPEEVIQREALQSRIMQVFGTLSYREREIIKLRYGLHDGQNYTLEEVGHIFKSTRERIREIEAKAIRKLQQPSRSQELVCFLD